MDHTKRLLQERGRTHGSFHVHAQCTQKLKGVARTFPNWERLSDDQKEALEMVLHKVGRILAGDPNFQDHWADIAGYARLVADELKPEGSHAA
jgi:hypothetical protein